MAHAVLRGQLLTPLLARISRDDLGRGDEIALEQPVNHGFAHVAAADEGDGQIRKHGLLLFPLRRASMSVRVWQTPHKRRLWWMPSHVSLRLA